jgi:peptide/nickel transport system substrate-binding protein
MVGHNMATGRGQACRRAAGLGVGAPRTAVTGVTGVTACIAVTGVTALIALVAVTALAGAGCDGAPARPKPWRHVAAPAPTEADAGAGGGAGAGAGIAGAARAAAEARAESRRRRTHTLRIRLESDPNHLNPLLDIDRAGLEVVEDTVFESLIRYRPAAAGAGDAGGAYLPGLAERWTVLAGGTEIRLTLRPGVSFHDGHACDAGDVQFSLDQARGAGSRSPRLRLALADVAAVEVWGPRDVRLALRRPNGYVLRALAEAPILPRHLYGGSDMARNPRSRAPVGTGPYRFAGWTKGERLVLTANDKYWGVAPAIPDVEFLVIADAARALALARQGDVDILPSLNAAYWPEEAGAPAARGALREVDLAAPQVRALLVNARRPPWDDPKVREATSLLLDRGKISDEIHRRLTRPVAGLVWPGGLGDATGPPPRFDPARARALLDEAGWSAGAGGLRERGGQKLHAALLAAAEPRPDSERDAVAAALRQAGFLVEVRPLEAAALLLRLQAGEFDAALIEIRGRVDDDLSPYFATRGSLNWGGFSSRDVDGALAAVREAWDPADRRARLGTLAALLDDSSSLIALGVARPRGLVARRVAGLVPWDGWFAIRQLGLDPDPDTP